MLGNVGKDGLFWGAKQRGTRVRETGLAHNEVRRRNQAAATVGSGKGSIGNTGEYIHGKLRLPTSNLKRRFDI